MSANLPATRSEGELVVDTVHDLHPDHEDPQRQKVQQNLRSALLPMALVAFLIVAFVAAAWTLLAALPPS
ncbi:MAG: hypothetical protein M3O78_07745 [Chloroflexota bacterium]|nr:hypothetical protein [Chloroflexota bacterium]